MMSDNLVEVSKVTPYVSAFGKVTTLQPKLKLNSVNHKALLILGPSGVGKDTMINMLKERYPNVFFKLPSYTTRAKRPGEKDKIDYFFVNEKKFKDMESQGELFGVQKYNNKFYASNKSKLRELIDNGDKIIILNYNIETANSVKDEFNFNFVAILPPSEDELRNRLLNRGTKPEEIENRMKNSIREKELIIKANYIQLKVVNDDINSCFTKLENHIKALYPQFFMPCNESILIKKYSQLKIMKINH